MILFSNAESQWACRGVWRCWRWGTSCHYSGSGRCSPSSWGQWPSLPDRKREDSLPCSISAYTRVSSTVFKFDLLSSITWLHPGRVCGHFLVTVSAGYIVKAGGDESLRETFAQLIYSQNAFSEKTNKGAVFSHWIIHSICQNTESFTTVCCLESFLEEKETKIIYKMKL